MKTPPIHRAWLSEADCRTCPMRGSTLFAGLQEQDFAYIHQAIEAVSASPHTLLYRTGDRGRVVFTLRSGSIKLVRYLPDGGQRIVRLLHRADALGLEAVVGEVYQHNAMALTDCELCAIPVAVIHRLGQERPRLYQELMVRWQQALAEADHWLTELSTGSARQRIARLVLRLSDAHGQQPFRLLPREDIGAILGLTTETASRVIADWRRRQVLQEIGPHLLTCDSRALQRIADGESESAD